MRPKRDPVPRARDAASWLGGILLLGTLGAGVVAAAILLWENIDLRPLVPELASQPAAPPAPILGPPAPAAPDAFEVLLFASPRNAAWFPDERYHDGVVRAWHDLLEASGARVRRIARAPELSAATPDQLVVLPETPCLSDDERAALTAHLRRGGSVVADWAVGARDGRCRWQGWDVVQALAGAEDVREIPGREALFFTVPAANALSPGLDPGTRVGLRPDPSLAARVAGVRVYWSDWALNPAPDESGGGADAAAVVRRTPEGGRVAWFGFRLGQGASARDSLLVARTVRNGVLWAAGRPVATVAPWPNGARSALMVSVDVESQPGNAGPTADLLAGEGIPTTWFAVSGQVMGQAGLSARLAAAGEIGAQTPDHAPVAGLPPGEQGVRLRRSVSDLESWAGVRPRGLRPPAEAFDVATVEAWSRAGGRYLVALNEARSASPELHATTGGKGPLVLLPRLMKDDYNVFVQEGALRSERLVEAYADGMAKLRALGGLAILSAHTQILDSETRRDALVRSASAARAEGDWWMASGGEIADWWRARAAARVEPMSVGVEELPEGAIWGFAVEAPAEGLVGGWLDLVVPEPGDHVPVRDGMPVAYETTSWGLRLPLGSLGPGERRVIALVPAPEPGG
ncbi:MAG TPA: polysaccharide deacetylase family protein [Longimicrobiales bacterium]|nr:polysaccharide deacetylase family protein [Longimicrobiales bacterium]